MNVMNLVRCTLPLQPWLRRAWLSLPDRHLPCRVYKLKTTSMNKIKKLPAYRKIAIAVLLLVCSVIGAMSYKTVMKAATATKTVVYVYDSSYSNYVGIGNDPVYKTLTEQYDVKLFDVKDYNSEVGARFAESLRYNDLVFLSEAIGGTHKFGLACKNIVGKVPVVSMKSFFYTSGRWVMAYFPSSKLVRAGFF